MIYRTLANITHFKTHIMRLLLLLKFLFIIAGTWKQNLNSKGMFKSFHAYKLPLSFRAGFLFINNSLFIRRGNPVADILIDK